MPWRALVQRAQLRTNPGSVGTHRAARAYWQIAMRPEIHSDSRIAMTEATVVGATIFRFLLALSALALLIPAAEAAEPKRVLIIHSFGRDFAPYNVVATTLRTDLTQLLRESVALHETSLDVERGGTPGGRAPVRRIPRARNRGAPPELVIAIANPAMLFCLRYRDELFPAGRCS